MLISRMHNLETLFQAVRKGFIQTKSLSFRVEKKWGGQENGGEEIRMYRYTMEAVEKKANSSAERDEKAEKLWTYFMRSPLILTFFHEIN